MRGWIVRGLKTRKTKMNQNKTAFIFAGVNGAGKSTLYWNEVEKGEATCTSILALVAIGDCSIETAAKNGRIQSIKAVDTKAFSVLGIYSTYTTIVSGN